jgi:hypothetical protein
MPFEYFNDPCYYDMWAVREVGTSSLNDTAHVVTKEEAEWLTKRLNDMNLSCIHDCDYWRGEKCVCGIECKRRTGDFYTKGGTDARQATYVPGPHHVPDRQA